ncbi:hypothetical protein [Burkholderia sp. WSM2230]|uniref:hypothetical protein n=1 Tax=Burkholderia sp. WSM2230 TaxID=944435 RepID=UPI001E2C7FD2|nr:hypothetical protein [Burkholderia sp. WSM2230]
MSLLEASDERIEIARKVHCIGNAHQRQFVPEIVLDVFGGLLHRRRVCVLSRPQARLQVRHSAQSRGSHCFGIHRAQRPAGDGIFMHRPDNLDEQIVIQVTLECWSAGVPGCLAVSRPDRASHDESK